MTARLFDSDVRFRSPTAVQSRRPIVAWVHQQEIRPSFTEVVRPTSETSVIRVGAMCECDLNARLVFAGYDGTRVELPLTYLSQLWPQLLKLEAPILLDRNGGLQMTAYGPENATLVMLSGVRM